MTSTSTPTPSNRPQTSATPAADKPKNWLSRRNTVLLLLAAGVVALVAGTQTWVSATQIPGADDLTLTMTGQEASPVVTAMALVALAAGIALTIVRTPGRIVIGVLMFGAAALLGWASWLVLSNPEQYIADTVAAHTGMTVAAGQVSATAGPWFGMLAAVLILVAAIIILAIGHRWPVGSGRKYETASTTTQKTQPAAPSSPADQDDDESTKPQTEEDRIRATEQRLAAEAQARRLDEIDAWDELSRGEDPTAR